MALSDEEREKRINEYTKYLAELREKVQNFEYKVRVADGERSNFARIVAYVRDPENPNGPGKVVLSENAFANSSFFAVNDRNKNDRFRPLRETFAPKVQEEDYGMLGVSNGCIRANHTEPKLFRSLKEAIVKFDWDITYIILASEMDCCPSCLDNSIKALSGLEGLLGLSGGFERDLNILIVETRSRRARHSYEFDFKRTDDLEREFVEQEEDERKRKREDDIDDQDIGFGRNKRRKESSLSFRGAPD